MDEEVPSPATSPSPPYIGSRRLNLEDDETTSEEETNPLLTDDPVVSIPLVSNKLKLERDFIMTYESLPVLWNPRHPDYSNLYRRKIALLRLVPILKKKKPDATTADVRSKINTFRSAYLKELKKVLASEESNDSEVYEPKLWYFQYFDFLRNLKHEQNTALQNNSVLPKLTSKKNNEISQDGTPFESVHLMKFTEQSTDDQSTEEQSTDEHSTDEQSTERRKRMFQGQPVEPQEQSSVNKRKFQGQPVEPQQQMPKLNMESCQPKTISNHIVLEWVDILEKLDPMQRLFAKKAINDVLFDAELGNLNKNSIKINESPSTYQFSSSPAPSSLQSPSSSLYQ